MLEGFSIGLLLKKYSLKYLVWGYLHRNYPSVMSVTSGVKGVDVILLRLLRVKRGIYVVRKGVFKHGIYSLLEETL